MSEPKIFTLSDVQEAVEIVRETADAERPETVGLSDEYDRYDLGYADGMTRGACEVLFEITPSGEADAEDAGPIWERDMALACPGCGHEYGGDSPAVIHPGECEECGEDLSGLIPHPVGWGESDE